MIHQKDGRVKIVDFNLAKLKGVGKLTKEKSTLGTVYYMSPEQASGEDVDHRTDIWSLGVVLYEMLTGTLPFKGDYEQAVIYSILNEEPVPLTTIRVNVPKEFDRLIQKALAKTPQKRYRHINELMADLQQIQLSLTTKPKRRKFARRKPYLSRILTSSIFWIVIIALFGLAASVLLFYPSGVIPFSERDWILVSV